MITVPWRDPISGRWIVPRPAPPAPSPAAESVDVYAAAAHAVRIANIWDAVKSTAAASTIADRNQE